MSDKTSNNHSSRRKFLSLSFLAGAGIITGKANAAPVVESGETVQMLTKDGKLVAVYKAQLPPAYTKKQASKKDVLKWIHPDTK